MNPFLKRHRLVCLGMATLVLLGAGGCSARPTGWTGLTVAGDTLYAADVDKIAVLNAADGESLWAFPEDVKEDSRGSFYAAPAVDETHVIAASQLPPRGPFAQPRNAVWALDRETGKELWPQPFEEAAGQYVEGGAIGGDVFVIGNNDGNVYALDVDSGDLLWTFETEHRVWATPLIVSDTVYIGSLDRRLYALDLSSGQARWSFEASGGFGTAPALSNDTLFIGAFDNRLYAIDADTGSERWHFPQDGASERPAETDGSWFWGSPAVISDTVYAVDVKGVVYALDSESGELIWHRALEEPVRGGPAVTEDEGKLIIGGREGTVYAVSTADGTVNWDEEDDAQVLAPPVVSGSSVYVTILYGSYRIKALRTDDGREVWTYPPEGDN